MTKANGLKQTKYWTNDNWAKQLLDVINEQKRQQKYKQRFKIQNDKLTTKWKNDWTKAKDWTNKMINEQTTETEGMNKRAKVQMNKNTEKP